MRKSKMVDSFTTFLGPEAIIEGTIEFKGAIQIDGTVNGKICSSQGMVKIGKTAIINAEIVVGIATIMGEVNGTVNASERIELKPPARVVGDIQAPEVSIEEGVIFNGTCTMPPNMISPKKSKDSPIKFPVSEQSKGK
ncbi:polymer-forming cytoskeletal protein [Thermodesulfobacteriota bacterium]